MYDKTCRLRITWEYIYEPSPMWAIGWGDKQFEEVKDQPIEIEGPATVSLVDVEWGDRQGGIWGPSVDFVIAFSSGVAAQLIASWVWDRIKHSNRGGGSPQININRMTVDFDEGAVTRLVIEKIQQVESGQPEAQIEPPPG